jgi:hypothetical protein
VQRDRGAAGFGHKLGHLRLNRIVDHVEAKADRDEGDGFRWPGVHVRQRDEAGRAHEAAAANESEVAHGLQERADAQRVEDAAEGHAGNDEARLADAAAAFRLEHGG